MWKNRQKPNSVLRFRSDITKFNELYDCIDSSSLNGLTLSFDRSNLDNSQATSVLVISIVSLIYCKNFQRSIKIICNFNLFWALIKLLKFFTGQRTNMSNWYFWYTWFPVNCIWFIMNWHSIMTWTKTRRCALIVIEIAKRCSCMDISVNRWLGSGTSSEFWLRSRIIIVPQ